MSNRLNQAKEWLNFFAELSVRLFRVTVARFIFEPLMSIIGGVLLTEVVFLLGNPSAVADFYDVDAVRTQFYTIVSIICWVWIVDDPANLLKDN